MDKASLCREPARPADTVSWARSPITLCCPACGRSKPLRRSQDWPPGLLQVRALCPDCSGHGQDSNLLLFDDGQTVAEHARAR